MTPPDILPRASVRHPRLDRFNAARRTVRTRNFGTINVVRIDGGQAANSNRVHIAGHGLPGSALEWLYVGHDMAEHAAFVGVDMPGFGRSPRHENFELKNLGFARVLEEALDAMDLNQPSITADFSLHSLACQFFTEWLIYRQYTHPGKNRVSIGNVNFISPSMPGVEPLQLGKDVTWSPLYGLVSLPNYSGPWDAAQRAVLMVAGGKPLGTHSMYARMFAHPNNPALDEWKAGNEELWTQGAVRPFRFMRWPMTATFIDTLRFARWAYQAGEGYFANVMSQVGQRHTAAAEPRMDILRRVLTQVTGRIKVLIGAKDQLIAPDYQVRAGATLGRVHTNVKSVTVGDVGHLFPVEAPQVTVETALYP